MYHCVETSTKKRMNILITGASKGIGFDTVLRLAEDPENRILALSRDELGLKQRAILGNVDYLVFDVTQPNWATLLQKLEVLDCVDILVNNAGLLINKPFRELSTRDWERTFATNVFGVVELIRMLLPYLEKSKKAHI